jgi:hypothetical protein
MHKDLVEAATLTDSISMFKLGLDMGHHRCSGSYPAGTRLSVPPTRSEA